MPQGSNRSFLGTDLDGDGYANVVIAGSDNRSGLLAIYGRDSLGFETFTQIRFDGPEAQYYQLDVAGDVNADGYPDLVATVIRPTNGAAIYLGGASLPTGAATVIPYSGLYPKVCGTGDVNGDGFDDLLLGTGVGTVTLYAGQGRALQFTSLGSVTNDPPFGRDLGGARDINGDGYDDFIVGATDFARVYFGRSTGIGPALPDLRTLRPSLGYGRSVAGRELPAPPSARLRGPLQRADAVSGWHAAKKDT